MTVRKRYDRLGKYAMAPPLVDKMSRSHFGPTCPEAGQRKSKMKGTLERAKLESELHNIQRLVDRIPPDVLAELKREQRHG